MNALRTQIMEAAQDITISNEMGLHARPAAEFVRRANAFRSDIWLIANGRRYSALSLIDVMRANLSCGSVARLEAKGPDAEEAVKRLVGILENIRE
jgi:phosphocarrier protein HPr